MDSNPIQHPSPAKKKWNICFWIKFTSDDLPGWLMNLNPIYHPSPTKKMKCSIFDYIQLLIISQAGRWTQTPSAIPLQQKKWNAHFCITFNFWCWPDWSIDSNPIHHPSAAKKMKCFFYGLHSTSDDWPGWVMDSKSICQPSPANKMKCFFLDYVHFWWSARLVDGLEPHLPSFSSQKNEMLTFGLCSLRMISQAGRWTQTPSITPLQPIKWNTHFWITFNFWWSAGLVGGLKPHLPPSPANKMKCSYLYYVQLLMIGWAGQRTWTPSSTSLQPKKWNAHFCIMFNF